nr:MAG: hypothetical protein 2 [Sobelivirales sp.]
MKVIPGEPLNPSKLAQVLDCCVDMRPKINLGGGEKVDSELLLRLIKVAISNVDLKSSPGYPLSYIGGTNSAVFEVLGHEAIERMVMDRIYLINAVPYAKWSELRSIDFVTLGLCDPVNMFIKNELHSTKKVKEGQWRLIWSVSLIDQIIDRVFSSALNSDDIENYADLPVCPGMSRNEEGRKIIHGKIMRMRTPVGDDVGAWDFSVTWQQMNFDADRRARRYGLAPKTATIFHKRALMLASKVLKMPGGEILAQIKLCVKPSGAFNTSSGNSWERVATSAVITKDKITAEAVKYGCIAQGDDCVEDVPQDFPLVSRYFVHGFRLKEPEWMSDGKGVEFCALRFFEDGFSHPTRPGKLLASFFQNYPMPDVYYERRYQLVQIELLGTPPVVLERIIKLLDTVHEAMSS